MVNPFDRLIQELQGKIGDLNTSQSSLFILLQNASLLNNPSGNPLELNEIVDAFQAQSDYTRNVFHLFSTLPPQNNTLEQLNSAINLVQLYFQGSKPLPQILSNLIDGIESLNPVPTNIDSIRASVNSIITDRNNLQNSLNKVLREFSSGVDEQNLQQLVQKSNNILNALKPLLLNVNNITFDDKSSSSNLLPLIKEFIEHLKKAQKIFRTFSQKAENLTGNEPDEIQQLIRNWGVTINQIEILEKGDSIKDDFNKNVSKSKEAIAQSIKIHELLEQNYDFLTTLVRSGDLESAGIL